MSEAQHEISSAHLSIEKVGEILKTNVRLKLSEDSIKKIKKCRKYLDLKLKSGNEVFYGINTGFGSLCNTVISKKDLSQLQENLVMSHACGLGDEVEHDIVKLMLLLKIQGLSYGYSGIALETIERLIDFYNNDIMPVVYQQGSLGASGDLAPLAHISLPLLGKGYVDFDGKRRKAKDVLEELNWEPIVLNSKEGLALLNGTQFMSAHAVWSLIKANHLSEFADLVGTISLEGFDGSISSFAEAVHLVRPHRGQLKTARNIRKYLEGSELINQDKVNVQDPYSFRCMPQVHGASKDVIDYVWEVVEIEINSVTDNPTIFPDEDMIISAGNFHGQPLALSLDNLAIAIAELGSISERRIYKLISGTRGLPPFLVANPGLNSGFMIPQYSAASVVSKNKQLCTPSSVDTIDSSNGQEDHVSMGANAATKTLEVIKNVEKIIGVELFTATQALEFRKPLKSSECIESLIVEFRKLVPFVGDDKIMQGEMEKSRVFVQEFEF
jgi:histidine ammonia-lyase